MTSDQLALVDVEGVARRVNIGLLDAGSVRRGDCVLIHMGFALERVDIEKATRARLGLELLRRGVDQQ
jgi:hydrogenase expression/formation protein HypC